MKLNKNPYIKFTKIANAGASFAVIHQKRVMRPKEPMEIADFVRFSWAGLLLIIFILLIIF